MFRLGPAGVRQARRLAAWARPKVKRMEADQENALAHGVQVENAVDWVVDELIYFRGHGYVSGEVEPVNGIDVVRLHVMTADGTILAAIPLEGTSRQRFAVEVRVPAPELLRDAHLRVIFDTGDHALCQPLAIPSIARDPYHLLTNRFLDECRHRGASDPTARVLEIGSRARSGYIRRGLVAPMEYVGIDILDGENTDLVGDAHELSTFVEPESFDAVFALSTFEHLAMPWKAAVEINKVLKPGGRLFISSHQAFPLHDQPWDFWRFSDMAWHALFNEATGFRIIDTAYGERASIVADLLHPVTTTLELQPAYLGSAVLAEKIGSSTLEWPVTVADLTATMYPG